MTEQPLDASTLDEIRERWAKGRVDRPDVLAVQRDLWILLAEVRRLQAELTRLRTTLQVKMEVIDYILEVTRREVEPGHRLFDIDEICVAALKPEATE